MGRGQRWQGPQETPVRLIVGLDVGSATTKAVVVDAATDAVRWSDYRRHAGRQRETCLEFLSQMECTFPDVPQDAVRVFATGSGAAAVECVGAGFVQEVNAVSMAVERRCPEVRSVIELGGEDAKLLLFTARPGTGVRRKAVSMNDRCAGGTGVVIDRIAAKLDVPPERLCGMGYDGVRRHPVAAKCGVFAETDVAGLLKRGVPPEELVASLYDAIVRQNISVLARGHTLRPPVLLLGGPNAFLRGMRECWRTHLARIWAERDVGLPHSAPLEDLVSVPDDALLFAALGAVEFARRELRDDPGAGRYQGTGPLRRVLAATDPRRRPCTPESPDKRVSPHPFRDRRTYEPWRPRAYRPGTRVRAGLGVDGGSTSTKAVLLDRTGELIAKAYRLSDGDPIRDAQRVLADLERQILRQNCRLEILAAAVTGYAKDVLKQAMRADVALVETVAHMHSGLRSCPDADVICDVGGQDIKLVFLQDGVVKDFRLNTQCAAGNGHYLQATAAAFGYGVEEYARVAFTAERAPEFAHGCAVFLQSDIVDYQRQGWRPNEILAGLAAVLPKNVWLYVGQTPDLPRLGRTFVLQGGVHRNAAAVEAQARFIRERFRHTDITPNVVVHPHPGEAGAIGCALEALRRHAEHDRPTAFVGFDAFRTARYRVRHDETTQCHYCQNQCQRTVIEMLEGPGDTARQRRFVVANCERGSAETAQEARRIGRRLERELAGSPNLAALAARQAFEPFPVQCVADEAPRVPRLARPRRRRAIARRRALIQARTAKRIGMPRVLNLYALAPFFSGYFRSLGVPEQGIVWSDVTDETLYAQGATRGSIDPCYPSKLAIPHLHNLLNANNRQGVATPCPPLTHIFLPAIDSLPTWLHGVLASRACPGGAATPEAAYAAFIKECDEFGRTGVCFKKTFLNLDHPRLCARQLYEDWRDELGVTEEESCRAVEQGFEALARHHEALRERGRRVIEQVEREDRMAIVLLARPYHNDPGINHGALEALRRRGYPILTIESLPLDDAFLEPLFEQHGTRRTAGFGRDGLAVEHQRRVEELLLRERLPQAVGRKGRRPPPPPPRARALQLQVRPRRPHPRRPRGHHRGPRQALLRPARPR